MLAAYENSYQEPLFQQYFFWCLLMHQCIGLPAIRHVPMTNRLQSPIIKHLFGSLSLSCTHRYSCPCCQRLAVSHSPYPVPPVFPEDGPVITGGKSRYEVGDRVKVNCTSYKSKPAAELTWFINNEEVR